MSKSGHTLAAIAVGGYIALVVPHGALVGVVTALAGRLPDTIEGVRGYEPGGARRSLIAHRTISHSPWPWLTLLALGLLLPMSSTAASTIATAHIFVGAGAGAVLHLSLDVFSPTGIPLGNPFGQRTSFGPFRSGRRPYLYRTSTSEEWRLLTVFVAVLAVEIALVGVRIILASAPSVAALAAAALACR